MSGRYNFRRSHPRADESPSRFRRPFQSSRAQPRRPCPRCLKPSRLRRNSPDSPRALLQINSTIGQVFWLPDYLSPAPSHGRLDHSGIVRASVPVTAAGPQRICTVFPILWTGNRPPQHPSRDRVSGLAAVLSRNETAGSLPRPRSRGSRGRLPQLAAQCGGQSLDLVQIVVRLQGDSQQS